MSGRGVTANIRVLGTRDSGFESLRPDHMVKAVLFDSDGMLTHGPRFSDEYSKKFNIPIDEMTPFFTGPFQNCLVGKADLKEELQKGWMEKWKWNDSVDKFLDFWFSFGDTLDHGIFNTVSQLRSKGILCALTTDNEKYRTEYLSKKFGYEEAFDKVFSASSVGFKKPTKEFFDEVMKYLKEQDASIEKSNIVFWDDDIKNVEGAKLYGFVAERFADPETYMEKIKSYESRN